jgi:hypothetical protein
MLIPYATKWKRFHEMKTFTIKILSYVGPANVEKRRDKAPAGRARLAGTDVNGACGSV